MNIRILFVLLCYCANANAYIDPGSNLLIIQGVLAVIGGLIVFIKNPIQTFKSWVSRLTKKNEKHDA